MLQYDRWCLPAGTTIHCPNPYCGEYVGRLTKDIRAEDKMTPDCIEGPQIRFGKKPLCLTCGHRWYFEEYVTLSGVPFARLHTGRGWFPPADRMALNE